MDIKKELIVVHVKHKKVLSFIKRLGEVVYYSKNAHYLYIYVDNRNVESVLKQLNNHKLVKNADCSVMYEQALNLAMKQ